MISTPQLPTPHTPPSYVPLGDPCSKLRWRSLPSPGYCLILFYSDQLRLITNTTKYVLVILLEITSWMKVNCYFLSISRKKNLGNYCQQFCHLFKSDVIKRIIGFECVLFWILWIIWFFFKWATFFWNWINLRDLKVDETIAYIIVINMHGIVFSVNYQLQTINTLFFVNTLYRRKLMLKFFNFFFLSSFVLQNCTRLQTFIKSKRKTFLRAHFLLFSLS